MIKNYFLNAAEGLKSFYSGGVDFLKNRTVQIALAGTLLGSIGGVYHYSQELERARTFPLAFSEVSQLEKEAREEGSQLGPLSSFLPKAKDVVMKVKEASNLAAKRLHGDYSETFARELEYKIDPTFNHHKHSIFSLLEELPSLGTNALANMGDFNLVLPMVKEVNRNLESAWDYDHVDHYRHVPKTRVVHHTDSKGRRYTTTESYIDKVYDHTTHTFRFDSSKGYDASLALFRMMRMNPEFDYPENLRLVKKTNADGEGAAIDSRMKLGKKGMLSPAELVILANSWSIDSTYSFNKPEILEDYAFLKANMTGLNEGNRKFMSEHSNGVLSFNNHSRRDDGPEAYRLSKAVLSKSANLQARVSEPIDAIAKVVRQSSEVKKMIGDYIAIELDNKKGNSDKLRQIFMGRFNEWHEDNFRGDNDLGGFRIGAFLGFTSLWFLAGILGAAGVNYVRDRKNRDSTYNSRRFL